jgi:diguanylate cyclase (GGDEF)-like protein
MKDPNDTRDVGPRVGSPLWIHMTAVSAAGAVVLAWALTQLGITGLDYLAHNPRFWVIAALVVVGEVRPIMTPGKTGPDAPVVALAFSFAALLFWGFPVAALLRVISTTLVGAAQRKAPHRIVFNAAQFTLSLAAAGLAISADGLHPTPSHPWLPGGAGLPGVALAAIAFFAVNFLLVGRAIALHTRAPYLRTFRSLLPYQAFANFVLLSAAPLVVVVVSRSPLLLVLLLLPLTAIYVNAEISLQREHQAHHDELTGLCNRKLLVRKTADALAEASRSGGTVGFLLLDLDRFKEVNDTLGHPAGDRLLRIVAHRLRHSVRPGDVVARLGGDEFAVLLPPVREVSAAREVASRLRVAIGEPIRLEGMSIEIEASVGLALFPDDATGFEQLLQRADVAMYLAKERRSGVERYVADSDRNSPARLTLLSDLRRGMDRGELELQFQPKVYLGDQRVAGMEALVRWRHPVRGTIRPGEFIPLVEQSYLMRDLTRHVVDMALAQASRWWQDGLPVQVSLNVGARDLLDAGLADTVSRGLARTGLPPEAILLEINERALRSEPSHAAAAAESLAALGVALSLDDFGTGHSSLVWLRQLPVTEVKIDSSFVGRMLESAEDKVVVGSIVDLVRALGIRSVAEGVESDEVATALRAIGCDAAQGWHFSRPLSPALATAWLAEHAWPGQDSELRPPRERGLPGEPGDDGESVLAGKPGDDGKNRVPGEPGDASDHSARRGRRLPGARRPAQVPAARAISIPRPGTPPSSPPSVPRPPASAPRPPASVPRPPVGAPGPPAGFTS